MEKVVRDKARTSSGQYINVNVGLKAEKLAKFLNIADNQALIIQSSHGQQALAGALEEKFDEIGLVKYR